MQAFARALGAQMSAAMARNVLRADRPDRIVIAEMVDRWLTGEIILRSTLPMRRERVDRTPVIDMIKLKRRYSEGTRVPFVAVDPFPDGWEVEDGRTVIHYRKRRYELGRVLEVHTPVDLWDERKVLWEDGKLK